MSDTAHNNKEPRFNVSITGPEALMLEKLHHNLEQQFNVKLSIAQVIKRLLRQADAA